VVSELCFVKSVEALDVTCSCDIGLLRIEGKTRKQVGVRWSGVASVVLKRDDLGSGV
jgi:hypothetical protein